MDKKCEVTQISMRVKADKQIVLATKCTFVITPVLRLSLNNWNHTDSNSRLLRPIFMLLKPLRYLSNRHSLTYIVLFVGILQLFTPQKEDNSRSCTFNGLMFMASDYHLLTVPFGNTSNVQKLPETSFTHPLL